MRALAGLAGIVLAGTTLGAQAQSGGDARDLTGTWNRYPQLGEKPDPTLPPPPPPAGQPPLKPEYLAAWFAHQQASKEADARGQPLETGYVHCLPDGMPTMMIAMFPLEILQTPGQVTITEEAYNQTRRIYLDEKQIDISDAEPVFYGHSVGHWDGDTLVVDTIGIKTTVMVRNVPHSDHMKIDERLHLVTHDILQDQITIEDPAYLAQPWTYALAYKRLPGYKMLEYVCENNREVVDPSTGTYHLKVKTP